MSAVVEHLLTVDDLDLMPDDGNRYELIEGDLTVSRAPSVSHQRIFQRILFLLETFLLDRPLGEVIATPGVIFDNFNAVIPDLVFVRRDRINEIVPGDKVVGAPDLAIEIVSPGAENSRRDRVVKLQTYSKFGVAEYWVIDGYQRTIEAYQLASGKLALTSTLSDYDELISSVLPGFSCRIQDVFSRLSGRQ